jgi:hypothetical protein
MRIFSNILMSVSLLLAGLLFLSCDSIAGSDKDRKPYDGVQSRNTERRNDTRRLSENSFSPLILNIGRKHISQ